MSPPLKKIRLLNLVLFQILSLTCLCALGQSISGGQITYHLGVLRVIETPRTIAVFHKGKLLSTSAILAGGTLSPDIHTDEEDVLEIGQRRFELASGVEITARSNVATSTSIKTCTRKAAGRNWTKVARYRNMALELAAIPDIDGRTSEYISTLYALNSCKQLGIAHISPADTDNFFEYRTSASGWWLVGSQDATVLISRTGRSWQRLSIPINTHNVLTAKWLPSGEFWILANKVHGNELLLTLYKTRNLGKDWVELEARQSNLPNYWFEATRQIAAEADQSD